MRRVEWWSVEKARATSTAVENYGKILGNSVVTNFFTTSNCGFTNNFATCLAASPTPNTLRPQPITIKVTSLRALP